MTEQPDVQQPRKQTLPSVSEMRKICRPHHVKKLFVEFYNPILSIYATRFCVRLGISANMVTFSMIVVGIIGSALFAFDNYLLSVLGGVVFVFAYFLDWVDGEVARYERWKEHGTIEAATADPEAIHESGVCDIRATKGMFLDRVYHAVVGAGLVAAMGVNVFLKTDQSYYMILGLLASSFFLLKCLADGLGYAAAYNYILFRGPTNAPDHGEELSRQEKPQVVNPYSKYLSLKNYVPLVVALFGLQLFVLVAAAAAYSVLFWKALYDLYHRRIDRRIHGLSRGGR